MTSLHNLNISYYREFFHKPRKLVKLLVVFVENIVVPMCWRKMLVNQFQKVFSYVCGHVHTEGGV